MSNEDEITPVEPGRPQNLPLQAFYDAELLEVPPDAMKLLHEYSRIPEDEVLTHIHRVRDQAWKTFPYPCIGHYRFLDLALSRSSAYEEILSRLRKGNQQFLDVGCGLGQTLRQLVAAGGIKSENLYGVDVHSDFIELGYELFRDRTELNSLLLPANVFDAGEGSLLHQLQDKIDIVWCSGLLHLFSWRGQVAAVARMLRLLKKAPATMMAGKLMGRSKAGEYPKGVEEVETSRRGGDVVYRHDAISFKKMFHEACDVVGEKWETDVEARPWKENLKIKTSEETVSDGVLEIWFVARKLERIDGATSHNIVQAWGVGDDSEFIY